MMIHKAYANALLSTGLLENIHSEPTNRRDARAEVKCRAQSSSMLSLAPYPQADICIQTATA